MPKKDFSQIAFAVAQAATGEAPKPFSDKQVNSRKGGLVGGKKRMEKLTEAERMALSLKAVAARKKAPAGQAGASLAKK